MGGDKLKERTVMGVHVPKQVLNQLADGHLMRMHETPGARLGQALTELRARQEPRWLNPDGTIHVSDQFLDRYATCSCGHERVLGPEDVEPVMDLSPGKVHDVLFLVTWYCPDCEHKVESEVTRDHMCQLFEVMGWGRYQKE